MNKSKKELSFKEAARLLKQKNIFFVMWEGANKKHYLYQSIYLPLKKMFKEIVLYDTKIENIKYGPHQMRKNLIEQINKIKPDYILLTIWGCGEFESIDLIGEINKASPETKIIGLFTDDDRDYEISSVYYALFLDYSIVNQVHYVPKYRKEGHKAFPSFSIDLKNFKPMNLKKKYDVSFIGAPIQPRIELMRFLIQNGIKVNIWGRNWFKYPEFKDFYKGIPDEKEFVKIINESRINLAPSKNMYGEPHFKGRILEFAACKSFALVDYFSGYLNYFKENEEIVFVKDKDDLLRKIDYYLKNEKEREKIAENSYNKVVKNHDLVLVYSNIFREIINEENNASNKPLPKIKKKIFTISKKDLGKGIDYIKENFKNYDYINFKEGSQISYKYKDYLQSYSLEKTKKSISCCDYYVCFNEGANYIRFRPSRAIKVLEKEEFNDLINPNQLMTTKQYFLDNFDKFRALLNGKNTDLVNESNSAFIDIPLVKIKRLNKTNLKGIKSLGPNSLEKAFQLNFIVWLYSLIIQKKIFLNSYAYKLIIMPLLQKNNVILKYLYYAYFNKSNWIKLKEI